MTSLKGLCLIDITIEQFKQLPPVLQTAVGKAVLRQNKLLGPHLLNELARIEQKNTRCPKCPTARTENNCYNKCPV